MIAFVTNWSVDSQPVRAAVHQLITLGIEFDGWKEQTLSGEIPADLTRFDGMVIDEERFRSCTPAEEAALEAFAREKYIHIISASYLTASQCDNEYHAEIEFNMFAAASGIERKLLPAREISEIMPFYLDNMEKYYRSCVNDCTFLHEYHLHSTMSLLAAEKHGALPPEWTGKINEILESMIPLITAPADFDEVASWGFARIAAQRCGHNRFLERVQAESEHILEKMYRAQDGLLSMSGWYEDPLFFRRKNSVFYGMTRATNCWRDVHLNEQLHYFGAAFPVLSMATGDMRFLDEALKLLDHIDTVHRDPADGLLNHGSRSGKAVGAKWGRGNSHALLGAFYMLLLAPDLPENVRQKAIRFLDRTGDGLLKTQTETGLWRNALDNPAARVEISCSVLFTWIYAHCINAGFLPRSKYLLMVQRSAAALKSYFWRGFGAGNCRASYPAPDIHYYVSRVQHLCFMPLIIPALLEAERA